MVEVSQPGRRALPGIFRAFWGRFKMCNSDNIWRSGGRAIKTPLLAAIAAALGPLLGAGCAIRPIQQDVTGIPTIAVVDYIRCETRLAIQDKAVQLLQSYGSEQAIRLASRFSLIRGEPWLVNPSTDLYRSEGTCVLLPLHRNRHCLRFYVRHN